MPILQNAKKALRQSKKRAARNKIVLATIKSLRVKVRKALDSKKAEDAAKFIREVSQKIDKAVQKKVLHKNTGSRMKSRMMKHLTALKAGK